MVVENDAKSGSMANNTSSSGGDGLPPVSSSAAPVNGSGNSPGNSNNNVSMSNKSETSSNASVNGSIKKSSPANVIMNSREDITSLGGSSSIISQPASNSNLKAGKGYGRISSLGLGTYLEDKL